MRGIKRRHYILTFSMVVFLSFFHQSLAQLHFVSLGSFGAGGAAQTSVATVVKAKAKEYAVSFLVSPGSNFFGGVTNLNDTKWSSSFEKPYESMDLPFFTVAGMEDWKGNYTAQPLRTNVTYGIGKEDVPADVQPSPRWYFPNWWYYYSAHFSDSSGANAAFSTADGSVGLVFVDTFILSDKFRFQNITKLHWDNLRDTITAAVRIYDWVFVVGDKAMVSSGSSKGDEHLSRTLRPLLKEMKVDAYISGNDHDMEVIEDGPLIHINCGAASGGQSSGKKTDNSVLYVGKPGFCHHKLTKKAFMTELIDGETGAVVGNYTKTRNIRDRSLIGRFALYKGLPDIIYIEIPPGAFGGERPGGGPGPGRGPGSSGGPPSEDDLFVRIVGTLGLLILGGLTILATTLGGHRVANLSK